MHAPWSGFQHLSHAYWRQVMQKLKVRWNSSAMRVVSPRSTSMRAEAIASSSEASSFMTKFFKPFARTRAPVNEGPFEGVGPNV